MRALSPKVIEFLDVNDTPIRLKMGDEKPCSCGNGVDRWVYVQATSAAHYWYAQHNRAVKREQELQSTLEKAKAEIRVLKQRLYGKSTESKKSTEKQNEDSNNNRSRGQQYGTPGHGRRKHALEEIEEIIEFPENEKRCPRCQIPYETLLNTEDSEIIEVVVKGYIRKIKRQKYRTCCSCHPTTQILTAPAVPRLIPKGKLGVSVWASLLMDKYGGHTPTHRYLEKLESYGISLAQGTITEGFKKLLPLFIPVVQTMKEKSQKEKHWHGDETRWEVFEEVEGKVSSRWYLWLFKSKSVVYYKLAPSRGYRVPRDFFVGMDLGILNCDRYVVYKKLETNGIVILALCWAHVRRDFLEVAKGYPELREWFHQWVKDIGLIYQLNHVRLKEIQSEEMQIAQDKLKNALNEMANKTQEELKNEQCHPAVRKVLRSLSQHWKGLTVFVEHPEIPMDNNVAESLLRGPVTGRKGYYGSGSIWSAELAAALFTLIQTLRLWKLNPLTWLYHYLEYCLHNNNEAPKDLSLFLPWLMDKETVKKMSKPPSIFPGLNSS